MGNVSQEDLTEEQINKLLEKEPSLAEILVRKIDRAVSQGMPVTKITMGDTTYEMTPQEIIAFTKVNRGK